MPTIQALSQRLTALSDSAPLQAVVLQLQRQQFKAVLTGDFVDNLCRQAHLIPIELALASLPAAACYALTPISDFHVGAVAIGQSGNFYFGANQEFVGDGMAQTVHAEQSAVAHAWLAGETAVTDIVVNYTPCGHCRQFLNELNAAAALNIHLPHRQHNPLSAYLPDAFGPKELNISRLLFDPQDNGLTPQGDTLTRTAIDAANQSYSPYSRTFSGVALQCGEHIISGRYAENAAFNPSLPPLQVALNFRRLQGLDAFPVQRIVLAERATKLSYRQMTATLSRLLFDLNIEYVPL